jgi:hypothetical protein
MTDDILGVRRPEREMLSDFLTWYRQVIVNKVAGLSLGDASRPMTPTGLSPLGIVKHLASVEAGWFRDTFAGESFGSEVSNTDSFRLAAEDTVESVTAAYLDECAHSGEVVAATRSLDQLSARPSNTYGHVSLRWILVHMLEETARHAGHLDLMRESLDGHIGD